MIEEKLGIVSSAKIATIGGECSDGNKVKLPIFEFKLESSDLDKDVIKKYFPDIYEHIKQEKSSLLNAEFDCRMFDLAFNFTRQAKGEDKQRDMLTYQYAKISLVKVKVIFKENIPTYCFTLHKEIEKEDYYISNVASKVNIIFSLINE